MNDDGIVLSGSLKFLSLADLLQLFGTNGSSGILRLTTQYTDKPGVIYFKGGNPVNASNRLIVGVDAIYSLFGWIDGEFQFREEAFSSKKVIQQSRMEIILDGLRMLDDGTIEKLGPKPDEKLQLASSEKSLGMPLIKGPLVDYMYVVDEEEYFDGEKIIEENKHGNWMWVVLEGIVEIVKDTSRGPLTILRISDGAFVGGLGSFLVRGNTRSADAVAVGNVQLGVLDTQRLSAEYACINIEFRKIIKSLEKRLNQVTERCVDSNRVNTDLYKFRKNKEPLIIQGEKDHQLFSIEQGQVYVIKNTSKGYIILATLGKGDFIGHLPFIEIGHEPAFASVFGSNNVVLKPVNYEGLQDEYSELSNMFKKIIENLGTYISASTTVLLGAKGKSEPLGTEKI